MDDEHITVSPAKKNPQGKVFVLLFSGLLRYLKTGKTWNYQGIFLFVSEIQENSGK